jgi:hypothetical protein
MLKLMVAIITILFIWVLPIISHVPFFSLSDRDMEHIKKYGLIHFTTADRLPSIFSNGLIGDVSRDNVIEIKFGKLVWMYEYKTPADIERKHENLMKLESNCFSSNYTVCLRLTGFSDDTLRQMRTRHGIFHDHAIVFKGSRLAAGHIEIVPERIYNTNGSVSGLGACRRMSNEWQ